MIEFVEHGVDLFGNKIFGRIDEDGLCRFTCTEDNPDYQDWLNPDKVEHLTEIPTPDEA